MKVKCFVCRHEEIEVEVPDRFRKLAVARPWEDPSCTSEEYEALIHAVEDASGLPFGERNEDDSIVFNQNYVEAVWSAENGEVMLED